jgi:hypothetical protein
MDTGLLEKKFGQMGARLKFREVGLGWRRTSGIDIGNDRRGEFFDIRLLPEERVEYEVVDLRAEARHLLLLARRGERKEKFLCGHDERHWFVCAVPGKSVAGVSTAMRALQPPLVRRAIHLNLRRDKHRFRRRNEAFVRQGEWFFVPAPEIPLEQSSVLRYEPLRRSAGSKPHVCQYAFRTGGSLVMVCRYRPNGVSVEEYGRLLREHPKTRNWGWQPMTRAPQLYVRGSVRHKDHRTVVLDCWHRVVMNTEGEAPWAQQVVFLD